MNLPVHVQLNRLLAFLMIVLSASVPSRAASLVVVNSKAHEDFSIAREQDPSKEVLTYAFMKGRFHPGTRNDPAMNNMSFSNLVLEIAIHLQKQNFLPVPDPHKADLLIVVHYGATSVQDSFEELQGITSLEDYGFGDGAVTSAGIGGGSVDVSALNAIQDMQFEINKNLTIQQGNQGSMNYMAHLIGMEEAFTGDIGPSEERYLMNLLNEERYFVILMAYDIRKLHEGDIHLYWTTRYSIRATGQAFGDALKDMNLVAENYFGKNMGKLVKKRVTDKSRVELGELEVVGTKAENDASER